MASIRFYAQGTSFKLPNPRKTSKWLGKIALSENHPVESLTYIFCTDSYLLSLNKKFLKHSTYTDILSFDFSEGGQLNGEIYISIPRVRENSKIFAQPFDRELKRVLAHGLLHFLGYKDKTSQQKAQMRIKEEACLSLWK
ncbi:rRNA maturation RNase YbeY [soil metagenome]